MRFSIVTPVLNGMPWLPECVRSVAAQRGDSDVQHIILDAGSTDGSREWLVTHQEEFGYEPIFEPDEGQTDALAKGFAQCDGEVLSWLNADDLLEPRALRFVSQAFDEDINIVLVSGCCIVIDAAGDLVSLMSPPAAESYDELRLNVGNPAQPATFFRASAYRHAGGVDRRFDLAMDVDLWLKLARIGRVRYLRRDILARFRVHPAAKSTMDLPGALREDFVARRRHGLPVRSAAGLWFIRHAFVGPCLRPLESFIKRTIKRTLR